MKNLIKQFSVIFFSIGLLLLFTISLQAQEDDYGRWINGVSEPWQFGDDFSEENVKSVKERWNKIGENKQTANDEWMGDFFVGGETHGSYLRLSEQNGFVIFNVNKCSATVHNFSYGKIIVTSSAITFLTEFGSKMKNSDHHQNDDSDSRKWLPVKWRNEPYLVPESRIEDFGNYVAGFSDESQFPLEYFPFFIKLKAAQIGSADDAPIFPVGYEKFIKKPIDGKIIKVGKRVIKLRRDDENNAEPHYESETEVTLNIGKLQGVKEEMIFYMYDSDWYDKIKIRRVDSNSSLGIVVRSLEESNSSPFKWKDSEIYSPLKNGWKVTTSPHKYTDFKMKQD